jgi:Protein of unknown function (DUF3168)
MTSVGIELPTAERWLYEALSGDSALTALVDDRIFEELGPAGSAYPFVTIQYLAAEDAVTVGANRVWVRAIYRVRATAKTDSFRDAGLRAAADRIDAVLHRGQGEVTGEGGVWACVRERPFRLREPGFRHLGAEYRLYVQRSA